MVFFVATALLMTFLTIVHGSVNVEVPGLGSLSGTMATARGAEETVAVFKGIPYAKAPVGNLRWQPPVEHGAWTSPREASQFGSQCWQPAAFATGQMSEDCLFLNVATPLAALNSSHRLPVMVWIHGGAYISGASDAYPNDAMVLRSDSSVVVVTINYRLNVFGFLGSESLRQRGSDGGTGNYGIQDQRLAIAWVKQYIDAFGGNGDDITIFGESAGGNSVINHLAQPGSHGLFAKAIIQSGTYDKGAFTMQQAEANYRNFLAAAKCASLACLLAKDGATLAAAMNAFVPNGFAAAPVIDQVSLTMAPSDLIEQGKYSKVPTMIGSVRDEWAFFAISDLAPAAMNEAEFDLYIKALPVKLDLARVKELWSPEVYPYPRELGNFSQWWWSYVRVYTDTVPGLGPCGVRWLSRSLLREGTPGLFVYMFSNPTQATIAGIPGTGPGAVSVPHASDIPYAFGDAEHLTPGTEADLSLQVSRYWINFARSGDPNKPDAVETPWPAYSATADTLLRFERADERGIFTQSHLRKQVCDFMDLHHLP